MKNFNISNFEVLKMKGVYEFKDSLHKLILNYLDGESLSLDIVFALFEEEMAYLKRLDVCVEFLHSFESEED